MALSRDEITALLTRIANEYGIPPAIFISIADWESGLNPDQVHDQGQGFGLFACNLAGRGAGYTPDQLKDPETNARISAEELAPIWKAAKAAGESDAQAIRDLWLKGQRPDTTTPQGQQATESAIAYTINQAGTPTGPQLAQAPAASQVQAAGQITGTTGATTPAATGLTPPRPEDYGIDPTTNALNDFGKEMLAQGVDPYSLYMSALDSWDALQNPQAADADKSAYLSSVVALLGAQIDAGTLKATQATAEINKRINAIDQGRQMYESLVGQSLPTGTKYIPGGKPGGVYEKLGLGAMPAQTTTVNPFELALGSVANVDTGGAIPDISQYLPEASVFQRALTQALSGASGGSATPPSFSQIAAQYPDILQGGPYVGESRSNPEKAKAIADMLTTSLGGLAGRVATGYGGTPPAAQPTTTDILDAMRSVMSSKGYGANTASIIVGGDLGMDWREVKRVWDAYGGQSVPLAPVQ